MMLTGGGAVAGALKIVLAGRGAVANKLKNRQPFWQTTSLTLMAEQRILDAIESAELIQMVAAGRAAADPFKLTTSLQTLVAARLTDAQRAQVYA